MNPGEQWGNGEEKGHSRTHATELEQGQPATPGERPILTRAQGSVLSNSTEKHPICNT